MSDPTKPLKLFYRIVAGLVGPLFIAVAAMTTWQGPAGTAWIQIIAGVLFGGFLVHVAWTGRNYDYQKDIS